MKTEREYRKMTACSPTFEQRCDDLVDVELGLCVQEVSDALGNEEQMKKYLDVLDFVSHDSRTTWVNSTNESSTR